ncbi:autotransporter [Fimbriiglobus ruber]|uniref:Autotransporter n=1 Tax=Fimbriiglobus ruber TaxID=1908690 RepID=A0A225CYF8_9BACT|nr:autotransporter [Fimbriiglobus ruber]
MVDPTGLTAARTFTLPDKAGTFALLQDGLATYLSTTTYGAGAVVIGSDGNYYQCIASTTGNDPTTDAYTYWKLWFVAANVSLAVGTSSRFTTIANALLFCRDCEVAPTNSVTLALASQTFANTAVTINGPQSGSLIINGSSTILTVAASATCITVAADNVRLTVSNLTINGTTINGQTGINQTGRSRTTITACTIENLTTGAQIGDGELNTSGTISITGCTIGVRTYGPGFFFSSNTGLSISACGAGIDLTAGMGHVQLFGGLITYCTSAAVSAAYGGEALLQAVQFYGNSQVVLSQQGAKVTVAACTYPLTAVNVGNTALFSPPLGIVSNYGALVSGPGFNGMTAYDAFIDTTSTNITAHTPTWGPAWSIVGGTGQISGNALIQAGASSGNTICYMNLGKGDYTISCDFTAPASGSWAGEIWTRLGTGTINQNGYQVAYDTNTGKVTLQKFVSNAATVLGTAYTFSWAASATHTLTVIMLGSSITVQLDGTTIITATDSTYANTLLSAGCGWYYLGSGSYTAYPKLTNFRAL